MTALHQGDLDRLDLAAETVLASISQESLGDLKVSQESVRKLREYR